MEDQGPLRQLCRYVIQEQPFQVMAQAPSQEALLACQQVLSSIDPASLAKQFVVGEGETGSPLALFALTAALTYQYAFHMEKDGRLCNPLNQTQLSSI
jgi:hypothetical protein